MITRFLFLVVLWVGGKAQILCSKRLDIVVALDVSGSINSSQFSQAQRFISDLVGSFAISNNEARIGVFAFDHLPRFSNASSLDDPEAVSLAGVREQITNLQFSQGATLINVGLAEAGNLFNDSSFRPNVSRVFVVVTDGVNYGGSDSLVQPAEDLRTIFNARVVVLGVGADRVVDQEALHELAGPGNSKQVILLTFKKKTCNSGGKKGGESDESGDESDSESGEEESENEEEDDSCASELSTAASLICG